MTDWAKLKVVDLKAELKRRDLPQQGLKAALVSRLEEDDAASAAAHAPDLPEVDDDAGTQDDTIASQNGDENPPTDDAAAPEAVVPPTVEDVVVAPDSSANEVTTGDDLPPTEDVAPSEAVAHPPTIADNSDATDSGANEAATEDVVAATTTQDSSEPTAEPTTEPVTDTPKPMEESIGVEDVDMASQSPDPSPEPTAETGQPNDVPEPAVATDQKPPPTAQDTPASVSAEKDPELLQDGQKRKRRSASPPPNAEVVAKRARVGDGDDLENATNDNAAPALKVEMDIIKKEDDTAEGEAADDSAPQPMKVDDESIKREVAKSMDRMADIVAGGHARGNLAPTQPKSDLDRTVEPSLHSATTALYIANLMRPLRYDDMRMHLVSLATPPDAPQNQGIITTFHLDQIRTHAFAVFTSISAASRVRTLLHDSVWPFESTRKALWVDFVPPEKVPEWIKTEFSGGANFGGRPRSNRWEVVYDMINGGRDAQVRLVQASAPSSGAGLPPVRPNGANNIPIGPRADREFANVPTGPRAKRSGPGPRPPPTFPFASGPSAPTGPAAFGGIGLKHTASTPPLSYQPVSKDLARNRLANMRQHYASDASQKRLRREFGNEINRYSFEDGASFVDRGKEVFPEIRPPHRQQQLDRDRDRQRGGAGRGRGRRGGPGLFRGRGDSYVPSGGGRGNRDDRGDRRDRGDRSRDRRDRSRDRGGRSRDRGDRRERGDRDDRRDRRGRNDRDSRSRDRRS